MTDQKIIQTLKHQNPSKALRKIYQHYPKIKKMILGMGGTADDAEDIFQESIWIFYDKVRKTDFKLTSSISNYLKAVSRNIWLNKVRNTTPNQMITWDDKFENHTPDFEEPETQNLNASILQNTLQHLGEPCLSLLQNYYFYRLSMKEIAKKMGYASDKTAKTQKYKCLERAKKSVRKFTQNLNTISL